MPITYNSTHNFKKIIKKILYLLCIIRFITYICNMKSIKKNVIRKLIPFANGNIHAIYYPDTDETVIKFIKNK